MLDIFTTHAWLLESKYFALVKGAMLSKLDAGNFEFDRALILTSEKRIERYGSDDLPKMMYVKPTAFDGPEIEGAAAKTVSSGGNVAVIPLQGTMMKNGGYCSRGTKEIIAMINQANSDPNVSAIVLDVDSPGGAVDGTERLGQVVKSSTKPVVSFIDGLGASAAYWVASQSQHIIVNSETTGYVGSIGVIAMAVDQSAWLEMQGIKVNVIRSTKAVDKATMNGYEPITEQVIADYRSQMDTIHESFISAVKTGRGERLKDQETVFTGKVYNGKEAKKNGLADGVGTLEDAVNKAAQLARKQSLAATKAETPINTTMKLSKIMAVLRFASEDVAPETISADQLNALEIALAERDEVITRMSAQVETLTAQAEDLTAQVASAETLVAEHVATIATQTAQITTLEGWRAEAQARNGKSEDELNSLTGKEKVKTSWEIAADKAKAKANAIAK